MYSLIGAARLSDLDPEAYLAYVLERITDHPIDELMRGTWLRRCRYRAAVAAIDPGIAVVLELQLELGLRAREAVQSIKSLADWRRALSSQPLDRQRAAELVERAIGLSSEYGGKLVRKPDLKRAMERYHYVVHKVGMTDERAPHSPRYAYATEHLERQKAAGVSCREAAAGVSTWLGHGDGRGTWVERVYGREALAGAEAKHA